MKRFIITFLLLVTTTFMFAEDKGWYNTQEATIAETEPGSIPISDGCYYILTLSVSQSHFTLDLGEHLKDAANTLKFEIPVDKDYYNSCYVGQEIADNFRIGSLLFKSSVGKWRVKVVNKKVVRKVE